jgi:hypothetical protein
MSTTEKEKEANTCSTTQTSSCSTEQKAEGKKDEALKVEIGQEAKAEKKEKSGGCCGG